MTSAGISRRRRPYFALALSASLLLSSCGSDGDPGQGGSDEPEVSAEEAAAAAEQERLEQVAAAQEAALSAPSEEHLERAAEIVEEYSTEELAGAVIVGEFAGTDATQMAGMIQELNLAGSIIMGGNVPRNDQGVDTTALAAELETLAGGSADREVPAMISVDQ